MLVALAWPDHVHHRVARTWFLATAASGWATCPLTESGFVRVSSNPVVPHAVTPADLALLARLRDVEDHRFLADDVSLVASPHVDRRRIGSHRQVADAHVVAVARGHGARLATLDVGLRRALGRGPDDEAVVVLGGA